MLEFCCLQEESKVYTVKKLTNNGIFLALDKILKKLNDLSY
jgi:hypothetical protein